MRQNELYIYHESITYIDDLKVLNMVEHLQPKSKCLWKKVGSLSKRKKGFRSLVVVVAASETAMVVDLLVSGRKLLVSVSKR